MRTFWWWNSKFLNQVSIYSIQARKNHNHPLNSMCKKFLMTKFKILESSQNILHPSKERQRLSSSTKVCKIVDGKIQRSWIKYHYSPSKLEKALSNHFKPKCVKFRNTKFTNSLQSSFNNFHPIQKKYQSSSSTQSVRNYWLPNTGNFILQFFLP